MIIRREVERDRWLRLYELKGSSWEIIDDEIENKIMKYECERATGSKHINPDW